jgi:hypothetical protein
MFLERFAALARCGASLNRRCCIDLARQFYHVVAAAHAGFTGTGPLFGLTHSGIYLSLL